MVEILFLTHNRREFSEAALRALVENTDWSKVSRLWLFDDNSTDGTREFLQDFIRTFDMAPMLFVPGTWGSPIEAMKQFFTQAESEYVVKLDSDVMVPPGWLGDCLEVLIQSPDVDLLGIEARGGSSEESAPTGTPRTADPAVFIGGIGIFRLSSIKKAMARLSLGCNWEQGRWFGWQSFQNKADLKPAWIKPSLQVFLLDRMSLEPWRSLSDLYVTKGWQRPAPYRYGPEWSGLWNWF